MGKKQVIPYSGNKNSKKTQIRQMFDGISPQYDLMNRVITFGVDIKWRKNVVAMLLPKKPKKILDVATGTSDLAISLTETNATEIIGIDISIGMLDIGKKKVKKHNRHKKIKLEIGDSEEIRYPSNYFDAVTVAFGVRNFENLDKGLSEILRVLRPGGDLIILETSVPQKIPIRQFYQLYIHFIMPFMSWIFSRDKSAYQYLSDSAKKFPFGMAFNNILEKNGFIGVEDIPQTFGVASIYRAQKPTS